MPIRLTRYLLYAAAFTPLLVYNGVIFPFIAPKMFFFRSVVTLALALFLVHLLVSWYQHKSAKISINQRLIKNPLFIAVAVFLLSFALSTIFAVNPYRAFWGDVERAEGFFGMLHFFVFMVLTIFVFERRDWINFFKISLAVGVYIIFFGFLEFFGLEFLFLKPLQRLRIQSYIGNPAFFASYLFFLMTFAVIVFSETYKLTDLKTYKLWRYLALAVVPLSIIAIFMTGTRGAMLGVASAVLFLLIYFSIYGHRLNLQTYKLTNLQTRGLANLRTFSIIALVLLLAFGATFFMTSDAQVWQKIPGLDRFNQLITKGRDDPSTAFRLITWELSLEAWKEKPIFGWGPENFIGAYQSHYKPVYAIHGESWMDRAHNVFLDTLVMRGLVGLLAYLGVLAVLFYVLFGITRMDTDRNTDKHGYPRESVFSSAFIRVVVAALLIGYIVQNVFVFDQIVTYVPFFAFLGFLIANSQEELTNLQTYKLKNFPLVIVASVVTVLSLYSLYAWNYVPFIQNKIFKASPGVSDNVHLVVQELNEAMYPYNFAQHNIRSKGIDTIYLNQYFENPKYAANVTFKPLGDLLIEGMEELIEREPYEVRLFIRLTEMLNGLAKAIGTETEEAMELYRRSEKLLRQALEIAPKRQEIYYHLAFNLGLQGKHKESIEAAQFAVDLEPRHGRSYFFLAVAYGLADMNSESRDAFAKMVEISPSFEWLMREDFRTILGLYGAWGENEKFADLVFRTTLPPGHPERIPHTMEESFYQSVLQYFILKEEKDKIIRIAEFILDKFPEAGNDMEVIIDLAEKENWTVLRSVLDLERFQVYDVEYF